MFKKIFKYIARNKVEDATKEQQKTEVLSLPSFLDEFKTQLLSGEDCDQITGARGRFGLSPTNPIPVNGPHGEIRYLNRIHEKSGSGIFFHRVGSVKVPNIKNDVDIFEIVSIKNKWEIFYFDMYHPRRSTFAPEGYEIIPFNKVHSMLTIGYGVTEFDSEFPFGVPALLEEKMGSIGASFAKSMREILKKGEYIRPMRQLQKLSVHMRDERFSKEIKSEHSFVEKKFQKQSTASLVLRFNQLLKQVEDPAMIRSMTELEVELEAIRAELDNRPDESVMLAEEMSKEIEELSELENELRWVRTKLTKYE